MLAAGRQGGGEVAAALVALARLCSAAAKSSLHEDEYGQKSGAADRYESPNITGEEFEFLGCDRE